jgi:Kef-type K+ transport system membrane component KefB
MRVLAEYSDQQMTFWTIALGMGIVVEAAVIVLLSLLVSLVGDIERNVDDVWSTAITVARNTATTWMLGQTAVATADLANEVGLHAELLESKAGARR